MRIALAVAGWLLLCSAVSLVQYAIDKRQARRAARRISERILLLTCLAGGWPGAALAAKIFRHKTRKESYRRLFSLAVAGNIALLSLLIWAIWPLLLNQSS
jgi:uncharacterized membrane protein YsdA (DUF1294 family)